LVKKKFTKENVSRVRHGPGVYRLFAKNAKKPTYIGSSSDVRTRLQQHKKQKRYRRYDVQHTDSTREARQLEKRMIRRNKPRRNIVYLE
jgi:excinuclease UvrABC nuclease subunit